MKTLLFFTDRFPYGKGEAFIENEIECLSNSFDNILVIPLGLTVDITYERALPSNYKVLPPANTDDLYRFGRPSKIARVHWSIKYMSKWILRSLIKQEMFTAIRGMIVTHNLTIERVMQHIRYMAQYVRNASHFKRYSDYIDQNSDIYIYSYWLNYGTKLVEETICSKNLIVRRRVCRAHGYDLYSDRRRCDYIPFQQMAVEYFDKICLISKNGLEYIATKYPDYEEKYTLAYLGTYDYGIESKRKDDKFTIVSCSSVIPVKRVERIVDALSIIKDIKIHWLHFGEGQDYQWLVRYAAEKLKDNVFVSYSLKGQVSNKQLMEFYRSNYVDLFINVSNSEGLPVSIIEAMSFGIPIIATNVGGTSDAVHDGVNGILLDKNFETGDLSTTIQNVIYSEEYLEMRLNSRRLWLKNFQNANNNDKIVKLILGDY